MDTSLRNSSRVRAFSDQLIRFACAAYRGQRHLLNGQNGLRPLHEKRAVCLTKKLVFASFPVG